MLQLLVKNLVAPLAELSEARLARALVAVKPDLAALIACHYFEVLIRRVAEQFHVSEQHSSLDATIDSIPNYGPVDPTRKALWRALKEVRNELIHNDKLPGPRQSELLIQEVDKLESDIHARIFESVQI